MRNLNYILDASGIPVAEPDILKWARWQESVSECDSDGKHGRHIGRTLVNGVVVSTVFLGLDHNFSDVGPPVLWETMIYREALEGEHDRSWLDYQERYTSKADAIAGHTRAVDHVLAQIQKEN